MHKLDGLTPLSLSPNVGTSKATTLTIRHMRWRMEYLKNLNIAYKYLSTGQK